MAAQQWLFDGRVKTTTINTNWINEKSYTYDLIAKIQVNGIDGVRKFKLVIPSKSSKFICRHELGNIVPTITSENRVSLPKYGSDSKSRIFWITKTPEVISSKGVLRKPFMINRSSSKEAVITVIVIHKTKTIRKDFVFEIENNKFKNYQYVVPKTVAPKQEVKAEVKKETKAVSVDYSKLTVAQFKDIARDNELVGYSTLRKAELIELITTDLNSKESISKEEFDILRERIKNMFWKKRKNVETELKELDKKANSLRNILNQLHGKLEFSENNNPIYQYNKAINKAINKAYNKAVKKLIKVTKKREKLEKHKDNSV